MPSLLVRFIVTSVAILGVTSNDYYRTNKIPKTWVCVLLIPGRSPIEGDYIYNVWKNEQKLDEVRFYEYEVLLSYPNFDNPNVVQLIGKDGSVLFTNAGYSEPLIPSEQDHMDKEARITWNAFSAPGKVTGELVYANYGREEDYDYLERQGISLKGRIVIARYGRLFRGEKVRLAQVRGAIGVLLYSDPKDYAPLGVNGTYPDGVYLPPSGLQRGTAVMNGRGDPLTPGYPSKKYAFRWYTEESARKKELVPSIPVQPITYSEAARFLKGLSGPQAPLEWKGNLDVAYRLGPGYDPNESSEKVHMDIKTHLERRTIRNVCGYLYGRKEPDRYVIIGNHYDAWTYGSMDPNGGTAIMLEASRVLSEFAKRRRKPFRRTLVFCAWDAEEYSLVGSTEFVEEMSQILKTRAVAYINIDAAVSGNQTLLVGGMGLLHQLMADSTSKVPNPNPVEVRAGRKTLYDTWKKNQPNNLPFNPFLPNINIPHYGSDHASFVQHGIPVLDMKFRNITKQGNYPLYHTLYETKFVAEQLQDPIKLGFHVAMTRLGIQLVTTLANDVVLQLNVTNYAYVIDYAIKETLIDMVKQTNLDLDIQINHLMAAASRFIDRAKAIEHFLWNHKTDAVAVSRVNERLMGLERCFLNQLPGHGITGSTLPRLFSHLVYGSEPGHNYKGVYFPGVKGGVQGYLQALKEDPSSDARKEAEKEVRLSISLLQQSIESAIALLYMY